MTPDLHHAIEAAILARGALRAFVPVNARNASLSLADAVKLLGNDTAELTAWQAWVAVERLAVVWDAEQAAAAPSGGHAADRGGA